MISISTVDSFQDKNNFKFQIFKLFTESLRNKGQSKKKRERNMRITALSEGNSWIEKPKLDEFPLIFRRFFKNPYAVDTHQKIKKKKLSSL